MGEGVGMGMGMGKGVGRHGHMGMGMGMVKGRASDLSHGPEPEPFTHGLATTFCVRNARGRASEARV